MPSLVYLSPERRCECALGPAGPRRAASWLAQDGLGILVIMPIHCDFQGVGTRDTALQGLEMLLRLIPMPTLLACLLSLPSPPALL